MEWTERVEVAVGHPIFYRSTPRKAVPQADPMSSPLAGTG